MGSTRRLLPGLAVAAALALGHTPVLAQAGSFGNSVVIDGDALLIGEPNNSFRPGMVYVYGKTGEPCADCGAPIRRAVVGGRSTHYCSRCQRR